MPIHLSLLVNCLVEAHVQTCHQKTDHVYEQDIYVDRISEIQKIQPE